MFKSGSLRQVCLAVTLVLIKYLSFFFLSGGWQLNLYRMAQHSASQTLFQGYVDVQ